jgi:hypothetical protein
LKRHIRISTISRDTALSFTEALRLFGSGVDYLEIFDERILSSKTGSSPLAQSIAGVVVVYTEREEEVIRIIGARLVTKREQALYRSHMDQHK